MSAHVRTCVPYVLRGKTGVSKHGDPGFPLFCPLNQSLARVRTGMGVGVPPAHAHAARTRVLPVADAPRALHCLPPAVRRN